MPKSTKTYRQQLQDIQKVSGDTPDDLAKHATTPPHFPYVWEWFFDFPPKLTWADISAWSGLYGFKPERWEGELLIRLDQIRCKE